MSPRRKLTLQKLRSWHNSAQFSAQTHQLKTLVVYFHFWQLYPALNSSQSQRRWYWRNSTSCPVLSQPVPVLLPIAFFDVRPLVHCEFPDVPFKPIDPNWCFSTWLEVGGIYAYLRTKRLATEPHELSSSVTAPCHRENCSMLSRVNVFFIIC